MKNVTNGDIRRLARRGGIKRMKSGVYDEARSALRDFITHVVHDAVTYTEYANRKTVTPNDIVHALKRNGYTLYTNF